MKLTRRDYLKTQAALAAATAAGITLPAHATPLATGEEAKLKWSKAPCVQRYQERKPNWNQCPRMPPH